MGCETGKYWSRNKTNTQSAILRAIYYLGPVKRAQLAEYLGLTMPTITTNVNDMISSGIVRETGLIVSQPGDVGRRAHPVDIVPESRHFVGVEMQGPRWAVCLMDYRGKILYARHGEMSRRDYTENLEMVCHMLKRAVAARHLQLDEIAGIGVCTPGLVNREMGVLEVRAGVNWHKKHIRNDIAALTGYRGSISVENNACARAYGAQMFRRNLLIEGRSFAYLLISDGIACPLVPVTTDAIGSVVGMGELGHMIMCPNGLPCRCGNRGCLEAYSSDWAMVTLCAQALKQGKAPILREMCAGNPPTIEEVLSAQAAGDGDVNVIIEQAVRMLGTAVVNINNFAGPSLMMIEGKLFRSICNQKILLDVVERNLCSVIRSRTQLVFLEPDGLNGARGAAALAICRDLETYSA